jgi:crotonobetaine/carnitine-CoA ligase
VQLREGYTRERVSPQQVMAHCTRRLSKFKVPRYLEYVETFEYTPSGKVAKHLLMTEKPDSRARGFDFVDKVWR